MKCFLHSPCPAAPSSVSAWKVEQHQWLTTTCTNRHQFYTRWLLYAVTFWSYCTSRFPPECSLASSSLANLSSSFSCRAMRSFSSITGGWTEEGVLCTCTWVCSHVGDDTHLYTVSSHTNTTPLSKLLSSIWSPPPSSYRSLSKHPVVSIFWNIAITTAIEYTQRVVYYRDVAFRCLFLQV